MTKNIELIEFPTKFPIKIMGENHPVFTETILAVVQEHAPNTTQEHIQTRNSRQGNYIGCTVTVYAESQMQLDNIYLALTAHPLVKVVL